MRLVKASVTGSTFVEWAVRDAQQRVGTIVKTGESRDSYPWDWRIDADAPGVRRTTGVAATRREALDALRAQWATRDRPDED